MKITVNVPQIVQSLWRAFMLFVAAIFCAASSLNIHAQATQTINTECSTSHVASTSLSDFVSLYEQNNLIGIRNRLDPAMIGFQRFIDGLQQDFARQKQIRLFLKDIQLQCGPDITVISMTWEKRFLELTTFQPQLLVGRMTVLMHRSVDIWRLAAVGGESPFGSSASGTAGQVTVGSAVDISSLTIISPDTAAALRSQKLKIVLKESATINLPLAIEVIDADQAGRGNLQIVVETSQGDRETFTLNEVAAGRFVRNDLPFSAGTKVVGDGVLQVAAGVSLTVRYADQTPGNNRPATVIDRVVRTIGLPQVVDIVPNPFNLVPVSGAALNTVVTSAPVFVSGINQATSIGIVGGSYSINGGVYTNAPSVVNNGASVTVQLASSSSPGTTNTATLSIGGISSAFLVTTIVANSTPAPFSFVPTNNVAVSTLVTSTPITVSGINTPAPINVIGGEYAINGGAFTSASSMVNNGASAVVRQLSPSVFGATGATTLTIGGTSATFLVTTVIPNTIPQPFFFTPQLNVPTSTLITSAPVTITGIGAPAPVSVSGGAYSINGGAFTTANGTLPVGAQIALQQTSAATAGTTTFTTLTIGGVSGVFQVTTAVPPMTLQPFFFASQSNVALSTLVNSAPITVTGITSPLPISIVGGAYSINGAPFTTGGGTVNGGASVVVQQTSSGLFSTTTTATLTIGTVSGTFQVTTLAAIITPAAFTFTSQTNVPLSQLTTSAPIVVSGINAPSPISVVGGAYSINGGIFTSAAGTVTNGANVVVQLTSAAALGTAKSATLTIGGVSAAFTVTTIAPDTTPDPFSFASVLNVGPSVTTTSAAVTITGINTATPISIVGGTYSINGGAFTGAAGIITNNQTVAVRVTSSGLTNGTGVVNSTVTIGGVAATFTVTTVDTVPNVFSWPNASACPAGLGTVDSAAVAITGLTGNSPISIVSGSGVPAAGALYSINGGAFTSAPGVVSNGQTVTVRVFRYGTMNPLTVRATVTIGGVSGTWSTNC